MINETLQVTQLNRLKIRLIKTTRTTKVLVSLLVLIVISSRANGQTDSLKLKEYLYNRVYKNIAAFCVTYNVDRKEGLDANGLLIENSSSSFFDECLPDEGSTLEMQITKLDWKYPVTGYVVYQVKLDGLRYISNSNGKNRASQVFDGPFDAPPSNYYLLCVNQKNEVKFISGSYFVHDVTKDFSLNKAKPDSYLSYLKFRTFTYKTTDIAFEKRQRNVLYFTAFSEDLNRKINITLDTATPGLLKLSLVKK